MGAPCRMEHEPENRTLHYPAFVLECHQVYLQFCPCAEGLVCERSECVRARPRGGASGPASNARELRFELEEEQDDDYLERILAQPSSTTQMPHMRRNTLAINGAAELEPVRWSSQVSRRAQWPWASLAARF